MNKYIQLHNLNGVMVVVMLHAIRVVIPMENGSRLLFEGNDYADVQEPIKEVIRKIGAA